MEDHHFQFKHHDQRSGLTAGKQSAAKADNLQRNHSPLVANSTLIQMKLMRVRCNMPNKVCTKREPSMKSKVVVHPGRPSALS
jgi:hypothetical protein